ncbi:MAG TPA: DUF6782 family putative metallopeptidase [Candidatus Binatia bacterium]|nr:DUF6782 family putative metallopeptidase [Candidatus Binatia bacterium]
MLVAATVLAVINMHGLTPTHSCAAQSTENGGASFYDSAPGKIVLDGAQSPEEMALTLVHEASHAKYERGKAANIDGDARADYVRKMLDEEVTAIVASIEMKQDLEGAGNAITTRYPFEAEYHAAYGKALEELKKSKPAVPQAELDSAAKAAGRAAVRDGLGTGKVLTVNNGEKYPDYYGDAWDKRHETRKSGSAGGHSARHEPSGSEGHQSGGESKSERKAG